MKRLLIILAAAGGLVACGGVDRDGTRDNIVDGLEANGFDVDGDCVDSVLDGYSDDELKTIDEDLEDATNSPESLALIEKILECVPAAT
jgi:hypothetical protein